MIEVAVCDDEKRICQDIAERIEGQEPECHVTCFTSGEELLAEMDHVEIVFLDIGLGGRDGMDIAKELQKNPGILLIFVTAFPEHVFEAFDVGAFHYLLKPIEEEKFHKVLSRAVEEVKQRKQRKPLRIKEGNVYRLVPVEDILYAESRGRKIVLYTRDETMEFYGRMQELQQRLGEEFFRCHRGYLVHFTEISGYDNANIYMKNGDKVYLAKQKYGEFAAAYMEYLRKHVL